MLFVFCLGIWYADREREQDSWPYKHHHDADIHAELPHAPSASTMHAANIVLIILSSSVFSYCLSDMLIAC